MRDQINWDLLTKYVYGECSRDEASRVESDPNMQHILDELARVRDLARPPRRDADLDRAWQSVQNHIRTRRRADRAASKRSDRRARARRSGLSRIAVAAVIVGLAVTVVVLQRHHQPVTSLANGKVFTTARGERATIRLADGSRVWLNAASTLSLPDGFGATTREVWLDGEAYFEVTSDSSRHFAVHAGSAVTRVLGTRFNLSAYSGEENVSVVVAEGKVSLGLETGPHRMLLTSGQMGTLLKGGQDAVKREVDIGRHLAWLDGALVFEDAPFPEVVRRLARWYDLEVTVDTVTPVGGHLNATFTDDQSIREMLDVVAVTFGLSYTYEARRVNFRSQFSNTSELE